MTNNEPGTSATHAANDLASSIGLTVQEAMNETVHAEGLTKQEAASLL
jgi:hypothetical protein